MRRTLQSELPQVLLLPVAGVVAGFLTIGLMHFAGLPTPGAYDPLLGVPFGAVIGFCLWSLGKIGPWKILGFSLGSLAAYNLALLACPLPATFFFVPGAVGAFTILFAILLLRFPEARTWGTLVRAMLWSVVGGALGQVGWALGPVVGPPLGDVLARLHLGPWQDIAIAEPDYSVHVVWQLGMGFVVGLALLIEQAIISRRAEDIRSRRSLEFASVAFFSAVLLHAAAFDIWLRYDQYHRHHGVAACITAAPPTAVLSRNETVVYTLDQELINKATIKQDIGAYVLLGARGRKSSGYQFPEEGTNRRIPPTTSYFITYEKVGVNKYDNLGAASWVQVTEYPNSDWARYELENDRPEFCTAVQFSYEMKNVRKVARFGQSRNGFEECG